MDGSTPLNEVIEWLFAHIEEGVDCPACTRKVKTYRYAIEKVWIDVLAAVESDPDEWVHLPKYKTDGQKESMLRYWELLEREEGTHREDGNPRTGYYRITDLGRRFLRGEVPVPRRIIIFANRFFGYVDPDDLVDVHEAYGHRFHYDRDVHGVG